MEESTYGPSFIFRIVCGPMIVFETYLFVSSKDACVQGGLLRLDKDTFQMPWSWEWGATQSLNDSNGMAFLSLPLTQLLGATCEMEEQASKSEREH